jgi:transglutaminase-like putative cysteine protease
MMIYATILCSSILASAPEPAYVLETAPVRTVEAVLTYEIQAPGLTADEWVAFVAKPPELVGQIDLSIRVNPDGKEIEDLSPLQRPLMFIKESARKAKRKNQFTVTASYKATLCSRTLKPAREATSIKPVPPLNERQRERALLKNEHFDFDSSAFAEWLKHNDLLRSDDETDIDLARRIFNTIKAGFSYDYKPDLDRHASAVCETKKSDCGGLSVLFASALRANGIPARVLVGRWAQSAREGQALNGVPYYQTHVKAEFFAENVGWVPVDMASAILHDRAGNGARFFGNDPGDFITMHIDPDVIVDTIHFGRKQTPWMQGVTFWVTGQGSLAKFTTQESWTVKQVE